MKKYIVLSGIGPDRTGLVDDMAAFLAARGLNIEESRMAVLGGEFALILLASGEEKSTDSLGKDLTKLEKQTSLALSLKQTGPPKKESAAPALPYELHVTGMDHPGIVHEVTQVLHERNINIESLETHTSSAPISGTPIFSMRCIVSVPAEIKIAEIREELRDISDELNMDLDFEPQT